MLDNLIPLLSVFLSTGLFQYAFVPVICLGFLATVPCIIRQIIGR